MDTGIHARFEFRSIRQEEADEAVRIEQICFPPNEACSEEHMKRLISFLLCIVMITMLAVCAESSDSEDAMVFSQVIARLKRVNSRASVEDARNILNNIASNYQQANMFSLYASAILDIYDEDFDRARIRLELLEMRMNFAELLENNGLPGCETVKRYIDARCAEREGRYDAAIEIYIYL